MNYYVNKPYPEPRVTKQNPFYAHLLMQDYAGSVSEDTAIHLYFYQHLIQNNIHKDLATALEKISVVEMHHFELLGETIKLLGVDPVFAVKHAETGAMIPWTASNVDYAKDVKRQLEIDIQSESMAIENYKLHRQIIEDPYIKQLLTRIIEDEELHLQIFYSFYRMLK